MTIECSFVDGAWRRDDWIQVRSPAWGTEINNGSLSIPGSETGNSRDQKKR